MESGTEILRVTAAIVSAFHTAADTLATIKDNKERRKRKKERDLEELLEIKILHKSLVEGEARCRKHCDNRQQQFTSEFSAGDEIAISALKDVVISLQTDVIQALHIARNEENAVLDFNTLHESSVANRNDATKAMDQLCHRIMASRRFQPQGGSNTFGTTDPSASSIRSSFASIKLSDNNEPYALPPSPPASSVGSPRQFTYQRKPVQHGLTVQRSSEGLDHRSESDMQSPSTPGWISLQHERSFENPTTGNDSDSTVHQKWQDHSRQMSREGVESEQRSPSSLQQLKHESESVPASLASKSTMSPNASALLQITPISGTVGQTQSKQNQSHLLVSKSWSPTLRADPSPLCSSRIETAADLHRAFNAPEVVQKDFDGLYTTSPRPDLSAEKYLAYRTKHDYAELLMALPPGMENIWLPLNRPAMHNRYHGFCKGAWQVRKAVHEGIEAQVTPTSKEPVVHWACKECQFNSKAPNTEALPDQILFNQKYDVRYRWLFLAKSHRRAEKSSDQLDDYQYGCIFCAAQGQVTAVHDRIDHLMLHIISKHRSNTMTSDVKAKSKCIIGTIVDQGADWDINIPISHPKSAGVVADELFVSASRFFNRRRAKRS